MERFVKAYGRLLLINIQLICIKYFNPSEGVLQIKLNDRRVEVLTVEPDVSLVEHYIDG